MMPTRSATDVLEAAYYCLTLWRYSGRRNASRRSASEVLASTKFLLARVHSFGNVARLAAFVGDANRPSIYISGSANFRLTFAHSGHVAAASYLGLRLMVFFDGSGGFLFAAFSSPRRRCYRRRRCPAIIYRKIGNRRRHI